MDTSHNTKEGKKCPWQRMEDTHHLVLSQPFIAGGGLFHTTATWGGRHRGIIAENSRFQR